MLSGVGKLFNHQVAPGTISQLEVSHILWKFPMYLSSRTFTAMSLTSCDLARKRPIMMSRLLVGRSNVIPSVACDRVFRDGRGGIGLRPIVEPEKIKKLVKENGCGGLGRGYAAAARGRDQQRGGAAQNDPPGRRQ